MKKRLLAAGLLFAAALFGETAQAQHYQPFRKGLTYHYIAQDSIFSLRVDSAKLVAGDSVFVFNQTVKKVNGTVSAPGCSSPGAAYQIRNNNQFGSHVTKKANGDFLFRTTQGQDFLLKTKAAVGQNWIFYSGQNITATLSAKAVASVGTTTDSVFTYSLSNGAQISLTKNYGFLTAPNFASYADASIKPKTLQFYALPEKGLGTAISDPFRIYDFTVGDRFTYLNETYSFLPTPSLCTQEWKLMEVLNKRFSLNGDSIYYTFRVDRVTKGHGFPGAPAGICQAPPVTTSFPPYNQTLVVTRNAPPILLVPANGFYVNNSYLYDSRVSVGITKKVQYNFREQLHFEGYQFMPCNNTFNHRVDNGYSINYGVGLGKTFESTIYYTETLIAYVKGTETYGRWQSVAQLLGTEKDRELKPLVKAFPNPFAAELNLSFGETSGNLQLTLINALGQKVWEKETSAVANSEMKVEMPVLPRGLYILKAEQNGRTYTSRLVKE